MTGAEAQQALSPSQTAMQMDTVINQWALTLEHQGEQLDQARKQTTDLQKENVDLKAHIKELEQKMASSAQSKP